ncbi:H-NS family nucleoid-associated regulatory protein [Paraburkholderia sp. RL17-337-BIB-A]|uniref:H-NS family nucleoid-associated regulatory protein n=1 Tax=Paraburkholderia sp. RL17-337-BIB-A TaxID=3031636 RepID=UPI0038B95113
MLSVVEGYVRHTAVAGSADALSKAKGAAKKAPTAAGATAHKGQPIGPQPDKYRDPKTGATWSGRGPAPAWLAGSKGRSRLLVTEPQLSRLSPVLKAKQASRSHLLQAPPLRREPQPRRSGQIRRKPRN